MKKEEYQKIVKKHTPKEKIIPNAIKAFISGGIIGLCGEILVYYFNHVLYLSISKSYMILCIVVIFLASLFTCLGFFDNWVSKYKAGIIIPTTGFAHSVASAALDYKKEGVINGIGSNIFKLAGSVIIYGIFSSFILLTVRMIING